VPGAHGPDLEEVTGSKPGGKTNRGSTNATRHPRETHAGVSHAYATVAAALAVGVGSAGAADLTNGSFETGDFTGWTTTDPADFCQPWTVFLSPSSDWCFSGFDADWPTTISAFDGSYFADVTWDGDGTGDAMLSQTVSIPSTRPVTLNWWDNTSWDLTFGATEQRVEYVDILNSDGSAVLQSFRIQAFRPNTEGATGWITHTLHLSRFAGQTVQIRFRLTIPEEFTGPANFALDDVTLVTA
jgi:hypothetical protein